MQPTPFRLQQAIRIAFKVARPAHGSLTQSFCCSPAQQSQKPLRSSKPLQRWPPSSLSQVRFYTEDNKRDIERKIEDAKTKIDESLEARADNTKPDETLLKKDETIIHTVPESSSIVYNPDFPGETAARGQTTTSAIQDAAHTEPVSDGSTKSTSDSGPQTPSWHAHLPAQLRSQYSQLPSQLRTQYSNLRQNFNSFMDNFQTHVFTASKRLNDLTGYSSIERLKSDIEDQEHSVRAARQLVRDSRSAYSAAIETRSATQREVNDLLHRKHAWSAGDLERFTSLYRSDHTNEQDEQKAHSNLSASEAAYEEASTKLSKSILARYHEEQVWSDKIRQMSTWGTWGLMGLNVLLFIVFQILIEPWRRRRLVRGFEEKVQEALKTNAQDKELIANLQAEKTERHQVLQALQAEKSSIASSPALAVAVDTAAIPMDEAIQPDTQTSGDGLTTIVASPPPTFQEDTARSQIEQTAEALVIADLLPSGTLEPPTTDSPIPSTPLNIPTDLDSSTVPPPDHPDESRGIPSIPIPTILPSLSTAEYSDIPFLLGSYTRLYFDRVKARVVSLFDESATVTTTRRDLTNRVLEGAFFGAIGAVTLFWVVGVGGRG